MGLYKKVNGKRVQLTDQEEIDIRAEWAKNEEIQRLTQYQEDRASEYPKIEDQLDMIYKAIDQDLFKDTSKLSEFYTCIKAIKEKYPKPIVKEEIDPKPSLTEEEAGI